jgi:nitrite reductase/ring-hydroxylating ferredoxin subunit/DMSO/TMAO reductase YedYZ heme-binding membrane subunit
MAVGYKAILWNRQKRRYDLFMMLGIGLYLAAFVGFTVLANPEITEETLLIRASGSLSIILLHIILLIGPLSRLDDRFLVLLYNRRHLGVTMFLIATIHAVFSILQFHALGNINPLFSLFLSNQDYLSLIHFPFQTLGFIAWLVLLLMASSSHDYWLKNLSPATWKALHMMVYIAYALLIMHVMLGAAQHESPDILIGALGAGMFMILMVHILAGLKSKDSALVSGIGEWVEVGPYQEIPEGRAKIIALNGERVAVFRYEGKLSAISNVCQHQNGPLGEGRVIDGLVTCPWHGYQYRPHDGCSPPPFTEKVATYQLKLQDEVVFVRSAGEAPGTPVEPVKISDNED